MAASPLIADLKQRHGNGLLSRFAAKLMELASLPARLAACRAASLPNTLARLLRSDGIGRWYRRYRAWPARPLGRSGAGHCQGLQDRGPERMELPSPGRPRPRPRRPARLRRSPAPGGPADHGARPLRALPCHDRGARRCMNCRCARASSTSFEERAAADGFSRVTKVRLSIGALSHVDPKAISFGFDVMTRTRLLTGRCSKSTSRPDKPSAWPAPRP